MITGLIVRRRDLRKFQSCRRSVRFFIAASPEIRLALNAAASASSIPIIAWIQKLHIRSFSRLCARLCLVDVRAAKTCMITLARYLLRILLLKCIELLAKLVLQALCRPGGGAGRGRGRRGAGGF